MEGGESGRERERGIKLKEPLFKKGMEGIIAGERSSGRKKKHLREPFPF